MRAASSRQAVKHLVQSTLARTGYQVVRRREDVLPHDFDPAFPPLYEACRECTMTSAERMYGLFDATRYVVHRRIPGAVVECGVWRGGSAMLAALVLRAQGDVERDLYLYDTYKGMTQPTAPDGVDAAIGWERSEVDGVNLWCYSSLEEVRANMRRTGYPAERIRLVEGKVEETIPTVVPERIALLRLDTDWYASTRHELEHLYPLLVSGGVLVIDDYGDWSGARKAVDEYLAGLEVAPLLTRVDGARIAVKP